MIDIKHVQQTFTCLTRHTLHLFFASILCLSFYAVSAHAQETVAPEKEATHAEVETKTKASALRLEIRQRINKIIIDTIEEEDRLSQLRTARRKIVDPSLLKDYDKQIETSQTFIQKQHMLLSQLLTGGTTIEELSQPRKTEFNWQQDIMLVLQPFFKELSNLTEGTRIQEALENDLIHATFQLERIEQSIQKLHDLNTLEFDKVTRARIMATDKKLNELLDARQNEVEVLRIQLAEISSKEVSYWETLHTGFIHFITHKGLNYTISAVITALVFFLFYFLSLIPQRLAKTSKGEKKFTHRFWNMMCRIAAIVCSALALIICLYVLKEWLLFGVILLLYIGIILSVKNSLPKYFTESRTLLNMGPIKEGERIVFNGVAWKIKKLGILTELVNPALGARLLVPVSHLVDFYSRRYSADEGWFPTKVGDYVILNDNRYAKIVRQNLEYVELTTLGGSSSIFNTTDFTSALMRNLSTGWAASCVFGLDYALQADITEKIPLLIKAGIEKAIKHTEFDAAHQDIIVEFDEAAASSLNIKVIVAMSGESADKFHVFRRWLQKTLVDLCNEHQWTIPFSQLTVHMESN